MIFIDEIQVKIYKMRILVLEETDWLIRGPHMQHHVFERLSTKPNVKITVLDYDIDKMQSSNSVFIKKQIFRTIDRTLRNSQIQIIRTSHIQIPYFRRISCLITNFIEMMKIIRKHRPDIIIALSLSNGFIGLILSKIFKIPYIFYYIDIYHALVPFPSARNIARIFSRYLLKKSDLIIVINKLLQNYVINEGVSSHKIKILLNGISLENITINESKVKELRKKYSLNEDDFIIFFMGFLYEFAGLKQIIEHYNNDIKEGNLNLKFLIVGDGGIYNDLINYVREVNADWVILTGRVPFFDISEYISLANLCLMSFDLNEITSHITPIKITEYMVMKKPVLSNRLPGIVIEIGENNGVIFVKNQKAIIKEIGEWASKKEELERIGQKGFQLIKENYLMSNIIKELKRIIISVIKQKRS